MFELDQEVLEAYESIPEWAKEGLCGKGACWQYSGNAVLGWNWVADGSRYSRLNFGYNLEIPSNPLAYMDVTHSLIYDQKEPIEIDFQEVDNHYYFVINKPSGNEMDMIIGMGKTRLLAGLDLYRNACDYYVKTHMPSVTDLDCADNFFTDTDGHMALDMSSFYAAQVLFASYNHFVVEKYQVGNLDNKLQAEHGVIKFVEGDVRVYSNHGVEERPEPDPNTLSIGSNLMVSGSWTFADSSLHIDASTMTMTDTDGTVYKIEGKAIPEFLADVVWKPHDII